MNVRKKLGRSKRDVAGLVDDNRMDLENRLTTLDGVADDGKRSSIRRGPRRTQVAVLGNDAELLAGYIDSNDSRLYRRTEGLCCLAND